MKKMIKSVLTVAVMAAVGIGVQAQDTGSTAKMRRGGKDAQKQQSEVSTRMQQRLTTPTASDADMQWMKVIYRQLDLTKEANAPLYFPEQPIDGDESLIRIIMKLLANNQIAAYEYLDGREVFTDQYKVKVKDILDRFHIYYQPAKGSTDKNPKFTIEESDVPATEVLSYYIIERWEFDSRSNKMRTVVEAICPVLHRADDYGMESLKYPMFWVKFDDIRPYLSTQNIFISDSNNKPSCTYDDYFQLGLYDGEIYKTRNLRNKSMKQLYPDPENLKKAQDSIENQLATFENKLWVPSLEELEAAKAKREAAVSAANDTEEGNGEQTEATVNKSKSKRGKTTKEAKPAKVKRAKAKQGGAKASSSSATRSVRNRKK